MSKKDEDRFKKLADEEFPDASLEQLDKMHKRIMDELDKQKDEND